MRLLPLTGPVLILLAWHVPEALGCERGTVRDAAFMKARDLHRLCVFARSADEEGARIQATLESWLQGPGAGLNMRVERIDTTNPGVNWAAYGIPSAPPRLPAVALVGERAPSGNPFVITAWEPAPSVAELDVLAKSETAARIRDALSASWAVVLHVPGNTPGVSGVLERVQARWAKEQAPGLSVVRLSGTDAGEPVLRAFIGVPKDGSDWMGVVFGKAKLLAPPLVGTRIGETSLNGLLESLAVQCTCLHESVQLGLDLPMIWDESVTKMALALSTGNPAADAGSGIASAAPSGGATGLRAWRLYLVLGLGVVCAAGAAILVPWACRPKV